MDSHDLELNANEIIMLPHLQQRHNNNQERDGSAPEDTQPLLDQHQYVDGRLYASEKSNGSSSSVTSFFSDICPFGIASLTVRTTADSTTRSSSRSRKNAGRSSSNGSAAAAEASISTTTTTSSVQPTSRWRTPEFLAYYFIVIVALLMMMRAPYRLSQDSHRNYWIYEKRLSDGWLFGRKVDNTDRQFRTFRNGLPSLLGLATFYLACSSLHSLYLRRKTTRTPAPPATPNLSAPYQRIPFLVTISIFIILLLHGISAFKVLLLLYLNFKLHALTGDGKITPYAVWTLNIAILFCNEIFHGYQFASISSTLSFLDDSRINGLMPGWHISFNFCMLRMVSFSLDWYHARLEQHEKSHYTLQDYTWQTYLAYVLYPPLYIAGPVITFNSFIEQVKKSVRVPLRSLITYALRFLICWLTMEVILHTMYVVAIKDSYVTQHVGGGKTTQTRAWEGDTPFELAMISFWNLVIVWLKLLLPWRFFRLWSLLDGVDPPENMIRCVLNNYSTRGFWRSWHRSYNLWLIKYLYIPISTATNSLLATLVVFTFVALWHDISLHLLAWGWLITLFVLPEMLAIRAVPEQKVSFSIGRACSLALHQLTSNCHTQYGSRWWYRHAAAVGALCNIFMMITANTVGFVLGVDNTVLFVKEVFGSLQGFGFLVLAIIVLFSAAHIMFEYREEEFRHGIVRKC